MTWPSTFGIVPRPKRPGALCLRENIQQLDSIEVLNEIVGLGERVLGTKDAFKFWLIQPAIDLNGNRGIDLISTESGRRQIEYTLHQIEFGQF